jgi:hypothetical protein
VGVVKVQGVENCKKKPIRSMMILTLLKGLICLYIAHRIIMKQQEGGQNYLKRSVVCTVIEAGDGRDEKWIQNFSQKS